MGHHVQIVIKLVWLTEVFVSQVVIRLITFEISFLLSGTKKHQLHSKIVLSILTCLMVVLPLRVLVIFKCRKGVDLQDLAIKDVDMIVATATRASTIYLYLCRILHEPRQTMD